MRKHPGRLRLAKQPFAQPFTLRFVGEIRQPDGLDGDGPADGVVYRGPARPLSGIGQFDPP